MTLLENEKTTIYQSQKVCHICKEKFCYDENNEKEFKLCQNVRDHCHYPGEFRGAACIICNLRYKIPRRIPIVFHNGSTYDYHFIITQLAEDDNSKKITYKVNFIDSYRFMQSKLSDLVDNLSRIYNNNCKKCMETKQMD